jgi:hypothetical protein
MAVGTLDTYGNAKVRVRAVGDIIHRIDWTEAPLLKKFGTNNESKFKFEKWPHTKYEWLLDTMSPRTTTIAEDLDNSETGVDVVDGSLFKEGDVIKIDDELMYVSGVVSNTLTVVRGSGSTTAAAHTTGAVTERVFIARLEGSDYDTGHTTEVTDNYNYTQIFAEAVKVTGSEQVDTKYGITDTMAYHLAKLMGGSDGIGERFKAGVLPILLQKTFYYGRRQAGAAGVPRMMGGFEQFVTTNKVNLSSRAVNRKDIEDLFVKCYLAGGKPDTLIMNAWLRRKMSSFYEGTIQTQRSEKRGGSTITTIQTDFGDIEIMFDYLCPPDRLYMVESDKIGWITYRDWQVIDRPSMGDYEVKEILGEFGFVVTTEQSHGFLYGCSTTT